MRVAVGSENPVKVEAVQLAFNRVWPRRKFEFSATKVASGVSEQPLSDREMIKGARQRAALAISGQQSAEYGVGLEGGLLKLGQDWFGRSWVVVCSRGGKTGIASSVSCQIPRVMMDLVHKGKDMKQVVEILYGIKDIGKKQGYWGILTNNRITRSSGYAEAVMMALSTLIHEDTT